MMKLALIAALLLAASPVEAQVATSNAAQGNTSNAQSAGQAGQSALSQSQTTGVICEELMTATFCNVPSSPNTAGYGVSGASGSSAASASSAGAGGNASSIPPCPNFPPPNELCN